MGETTPGKKPAFWKRKFYVHKIQRTYAIWFGMFMFVSSVLVFGLAFLVPFILPAIKLVSDVPLEERARAAAQFTLLAQTVWPALIVFIVAAAVFSVYLTHRVAGPLFRIEQTAREMVRGNLGLRIRLRKGDELHELAGLINEALNNLDQAFLEIRGSQARAREALSWILDEMKKHPSVNHEVLGRLETALKHGGQIQETLKKFQLSQPHA